jgi:hypothetical protein
VWRIDVNELESSTRLETLIPFVLRLGVTGHRDPADPTAVNHETKSAIDALLWFMVDQLLSLRWRPVKRVHTPLTVRIQSALAEGADRIAVNATFGAAGVAAMPPGPSGMGGWASELAAIVPYDLDEYRRHDCGSDNSRAELDRMISLDPRPKELQRRIPADERQRDRWYRDAGRYIADHCDVLLALWDGTDNEKPAGTAATVEYALGHGTPVLWIPTPRSQNGRVESALGCERVEPQLILRRWRGDRKSQRGHSLERNLLRDVLIHYFRQVKRRSDFVERARRLEEYNRLAQRFTAPSNHRSGSRDEKAAAGDTVSDLSRGDELMAGVAGWFAPKRAVAEALAMRYQKAFRWLDTGTYALTVAAVTVGAMSLLFSSWVPVVAESVVLVVLLGITVFSVRRSFHDRWLGYRALSEYWRSNEFVALVVPPSRDRVSGPAPLMERVLSRARIVPWFAPVLENVWQARPQFHIGEADVPWMKETLTRDWIEDQRRWHERKSQQHDHWSRRYRLAIDAVFGISVALVLVHAGLTLWEFVGRHEKNLLSPREGIIAVIVIGLASAGAALNGLASHANHPGHAERFSDVAYDLNEQLLELNAVEDLDGLRQRVLAVFRIMLGETSTWFQGMAASEIEVPT